jgi:leukotriene A-4 hydrolase/aminopeptidase
MKYFFLLLCCALTSCSQNKRLAEVNQYSDDPHSFSKPSEVQVKHLDLNLQVDFDKKLLTGKASWTIANLSGADSIIFDTRGLEIERVSLSDSTENAEYVLGPEDKLLGKALKIKINKDTDRVTVWYSTSPDAAAVQWLNPQQTAGKKHPFLFTQSQAILARTWLPCQDSPGIRFTYNATVSVPKDLLAIMSAENPLKKNEAGIYQFIQPKAIPSYLMALAVGDLEFKAIDDRTGVYAEPVSLKAAAWEFADMGKMVNSAEKLYGPYQWGRYDVVVLPPSFPFGGMENPMLTFVTPTVIAGDRSLVSLIAHELAHSWSGNLVTNATWDDFWLNEGFTVYFERRIVEDVYGEEESKMQEVLGHEALKETMADLGHSHEDTRLHLELAGRDPDEGMTDIAYEKGYFFLRALEDAVGRERMDAFLKEYFAKHAFQSLTTEQFVRYLDQHLLNGDEALRAKISVEEWIYKPGIPAGMPVAVSNQFSLIDSVVIAWKKEVRSEGLKSHLKSANEQLYLIKRLPQSLSVSDMTKIDQEFGFTQSGNAELNAAWFLHAIRNQYQLANPAIEEFLIRVGRRKFIIPLYTEMAGTDEGKRWAKKVYKQARPNYHSVSYNTIDDLLEN